MPEEFKSGGRVVIDVRLEEDHNGCPLKYDGMCKRLSGDVGWCDDGAPEECPLRVMEFVVRRAGAKGGGAA